MGLTSPSCTVVTTDDDDGLSVDKSRPKSVSTVWRTKQGTSTASVAMMVVVVDGMVVTKKKKSCCEVVTDVRVLIKIKPY